MQPAQWCASMRPVGSCSVRSENRNPPIRRTAKSDYEYERKGTCNLFMMCEPLRGWRQVRVTDRRTRKDYAECLKQ